MPLVAGARLPLAFIGVGLLALAVAVASLAAQPALLGLPHVHPSVVALAHLWLPGFLLSTCLGACYQLMPVVLGTSLRLPLAAAWTHLALHAVGVVLLVGGFAAGRFVIVGLGGTFVAVGVGFFVTAVWRTFAVATRRDAIGWSFPLAATWLGATVATGVLLAANRHNPFLTPTTVDLLRGHALLGLGGFFLTLLQGATFQLVPMFTLAPQCHPRLVSAGLGLAQAGLLALVPSLIFAQRAAALASAFVLLAGIACSGIALATTLQARRRRVLEPGLQAFASGAALLGVSAALGLTSLWSRDASGSLTVLFGATALAGALSFMILGMLCKIVPFLVWMKAYGPSAGRRPVPLASALGFPRAEQLWLALHLAALVTLGAGILTTSAAVTATGTMLLAAAIAAWFASIGRVALHLLPTRTSASPASPSPAPTASP